MNEQSVCGPFILYLYLQPPKQPLLQQDVIGVQVHAGMLSSAKPAPLAATQVDLGPRSAQPCLKSSSESAPQILGKASRGSEVRVQGQGDSRETNQVGGIRVRLIKIKAGGGERGGGQGKEREGESRSFWRGWGAIA